MEKYFSAAAAADDIPGLWRVLVDYLGGYGISRIITVHLPPVGAPDSGRQRIRIGGYPQEWIDRYTDHLHRDDPMPAQANVQAAPFRWSDIGGLRDLTPAQLAFIDEFTILNEGADGIAIPVFGPNGRNGYVGLALPDGLIDDTDTLHRVQVAAQYAHQLYCGIIVPQLPERAPLSPRELEILRWIAQGKSNSVIAEILGVSANTVDTHIRRIFAKLDVTDRVSAALAGLGQGIIKLR